MRNISAASLAKVTADYGSEPLVIVGIQWVRGSEVLYADRTIEGVPGKILEIANVENITNLQGSGVSGGVTIKLDDTDGTLQAIINSVDIHKCYVNIYQWFTGLELSERFPIYEGQISSPIVWSEADRTLSFDVVTIIESYEIGFSPEEGTFPNLPVSNIGQAWPLAFGNVERYPGLTFQPVPSSSSLNAFVIFYPTNIQLNASIEDFNNPSYADLQSLLQQLFIQQASAHGDGNFSAENSIIQEIVQVEQEMDAMHNNLTQFREDWAAAQKQYQDFMGEAALQAGGWRTDGIKLVDGGRYWPIGIPLKVAIGDVKGVGIVNQSGFMHFTPYLIPQYQITGSIDHQTNQPKIEFLVPDYSISDVYVDRKNNFTVVYRGSASYGPNNESIPAGYSLSSTAPMVAPKIVQAGSSVTIIGDIPIDFIINIIPTTVTAVWAYRAVGTVRRLCPVPQDYWEHISVPYNVSEDNVIGVTAEVIRLKRPLSGYAFENWEDQIYVSQTSSVGPNTVDIITWLIDTYTDHMWDEVSFAEVRELLVNYPSSFVIQDRPDIVSAIQDIAFQARCAVWMKNNTFYIKYLPKEEDAVDTITEDDILVSSLQVTCTTTEDLYTKAKAHFVLDYSTETTNTLILRNNIPKYGMILNEYTYYIYNDPNLVNKSATFWLIRKSNTWKQVSFKCSLNKLPLETFDTVLLDFDHPFVANGPTKALITASRYDSASNMIEMECWLPILFGQMTPTAYAWPYAIAETVFFEPVIQQFESSQKPNYYSGSGGYLPTFIGGGTTQVQVAGYPGQGEPYDPLEGYSTTDPHDPAPLALQPDIVISDLADVLPRPKTIVASYQFSDPIGAKAGQFGQIRSFAALTTSPTSTDSTSGPFPGIVQSKGGDSDSDDGVAYSVDLYKNGMQAKPSNETVTQLQQDKDDEIPQGTYVLVSQVMTYDSNGNQTGYKYYMQVPVWLD